MEGGISVTDILHEKVEQMNEEVKRLSQVLQAKEAVLEDVICAINQLPRHPNNTAVIRNVLKSEVKQFGNSNLNELNGVKCVVAWSVLFLENICVALHVENDTQYNVLPSCAAVCNRDVSDTTTIIFDDLQTNQNIPPNSKRTLLVSFREGLILGKQIVLLLDCDFVTVKDSCSDLTILSFLPTNIHSRQTQTVNVINLDEPLQKFSLCELDDLSLKEGLKLYQCLYACHFSKLLSIAPSYLRARLRTTEKFREIDFGNWQLFIGAKDTIWNNFIIYANSLFEDGVSPQCQLFSKNECDMHYFIEILDEMTKNDEISRHG